MIYCVVPKALEGDLYPKMLERYKDDENVQVIVERRAFDRRARSIRTGEADDGAQRRMVRDRRRARVPGDYLPLAQAV
jgi:hypothetical protein